MVTIRFFEELNDFLPRQRRKIPIELEVSGKQSVKDLIESLGVPNAEIDLINVNGEPVDFSYIVRPGDYIGVYPVIESMDISGLNKLRDRPLRDVKFIVDVNLGKLAKYLRMLGFDTLYSNRYGDNELIEISNQQKRIILTRDVGVLKRSNIQRGCWIRNDIPMEQAKEVVKKFDLANMADPFKVCIKCNGDIVRADKEEVDTSLEPKTKLFYDEFFRCIKCGAIYWKGSHYERMKRIIDKICDF